MIKYNTMITIYLYMLHDLPPEILWGIFRSLNIDDLTSISKTYQLFNDIAHDLCKTNLQEYLAMDLNIQAHVQCNLLVSDLLNYCDYCKIYNNSYYWISNEYGQITIACDECNPYLDYSFHRNPNKLKVCQLHCNKQLPSKQGLCDLCNEKIGINKSYGKMCPGTGRCGTDDYYTCPHNDTGCDVIMYNDCYCSYKIDEEYETLELTYDAYTIKHNDDLLYICEKCYKNNNKNNNKNYIKGNIFREIRHSKYGNCSNLPKLNYTDFTEMK